MAHPPRRCSGAHQVRRIRSTTRIVYAAIDVKFWNAEEPSADEVRPGCCPACGIASRPTGGALGLHGHGRRERQLRGPPDSESPPVTLVVRSRRYRCRRCAAVITVVPRGIEPRRHYSRPAIAVALARYGLLGESPRCVRRAVSPWSIVGETAAEGWSTLRRWVAGVRAGVLFTSARPSASRSRRAIAARAAQTAIGHAPPTTRHLSVLAQVFAGAVAMA